jgi:hypothetical protein
VVHIGFRDLVFARLGIWLSARRMAVWNCRVYLGGRCRATMVVGLLFEEQVKMADEIPIACCLSSEELHTREATLLAEFKSALVGIEELADGYLFRIPGDKKWIAVAAELITQSESAARLFDLS